MLNWRKRTSHSFLADVNSRSVKKYISYTQLTKQYKNNTMQKQKNKTIQNKILQNISALIILRNVNIKYHRNTKAIQNITKN